MHRVERVFCRLIIVQWPERNLCLSKTSNPWHYLIVTHKLRSDILLFVFTVMLQPTAWCLDLFGIINSSGELTLRIVICKPSDWLSR